MMKFLLLACAALPLAAGCTTQGAHGNDHWGQRSISNSIGRAFLGYEEERDGRYIDFQDKKKREFNLTIRRYFFHHNPDNPFEVYDPSYYKERYPLALMPDTLNYVQDPISSVWGSLSEGGKDEASRGFNTVGDDLFREHDDEDAAPKSASSLRTAVGLTAPKPD